MDRKGPIMSIWLAEGDAPMDDTTDTSDTSATTDAGGTGDADALAAMIARAAHAHDGIPPVERWHPDHCGSIPMTIKADGTWHYDGSPIGRTRMVRLFSTVLRREPDGSHVLVTPVERMTIEVEDAPFVAVEVAREGEGDTQALTFRTNLGDVAEAGPERPIRLVSGAAGFRPYVLVRGDLWALATRAVAHELAGMLEETDGETVLRSRGATFSLVTDEGTGSDEAQPVTG